MNTREKADFYTLKAKKEGYPARSVYKLIEIQQKFPILKSGYRIADIGASPGSWTKYALKVVGAKGSVTAVDLKPLSPDISGSNLFFVQGDAFVSPQIEVLTEKGPYDSLLSDVAPSTTGNRTVDTARSQELVDSVFGLAETTMLKKGGNLVIKVFQGSDTALLLKKMKALFEMVKAFKPQACRSDSFETYYIGMGKKEE